jgi:type IV pilus assembly protein PilC
VCIGLIMLIFVLPQFVAMFASMHAELPSITRFLVRLSIALRGWSLLFLSVVSIGIVVLLHIFTRSASGKQTLDRLVIHLPSIGDVVADSTRMYLMRSLGALAHAGFAVPQALHIATHTINNVVLHQYALYLYHAVQGGDSLSKAMFQHPEQWFDQHVIAMVAIGEESGDIARAFMAAADYYQQQVEQRLRWYTTIIQPLLIVTLGLVIALFVCAIYTPLFTLAHMI